MILLRALLLLLLFPLSLSLSAQKFLSDPEDPMIFEEAELLYGEGAYISALDEYKKLEEKYPDEKVLIYRIAVCYSFMLDGVEEALEYFERLEYDYYYKDHSEFYYGKVLHLNERFEEAIPILEKYRKAKYAKKSLAKEAEKIIAYCTTGIELKKNPIPVRIVNAGDSINTDQAEYVPVISSDESVMIFTYRGTKSTGGLQAPMSINSPKKGDYYEDIFYTEKKEDGNWKTAEPIKGEINTNANDACVSLSNDGNTLFIFKSTEGDEGTLYQSKRTESGWSDPEKLYGKVNSPFWEGSLTLSPDGRKMYFSSERPGGFGGKDLYVADKMPDGSWDNVRNMGAGINTSGDEDAPFLHPSGDYMIFSSNGRESMGGYDLFSIDLISDSTWSTPKNMGYPINTARDDIYYVLSGDGRNGYYSSGKAGGFGSLDIYIVEPGTLDRKFVLVEVSGIVTVNDQPMEASITAAYEETNITQGIYSSNNENGKYLINFPTGKDLVLTFNVEGFPAERRTISTQGVEEFKRMVINVELYTQEYLAQKGDVKDTAVAEVKEEVVVEVPEEKDTLTVTQNNAVAEEEWTREKILATFGETEVDGLDYKVQIGAYNLPQNFDYSAVLKLGKVERQVLDDKITRFTMGQFTKMKDAYAYRDQVVAAGITDAFVTAVYEGKRYLIVDLVKKGVLLK